MLCGVSAMVGTIVWLVLVLWRGLYQASDAMRGVVVLRRSVLVVVALVTGCVNAVLVLSHRCSGWVIS